MLVLRGPQRLSHASKRNGVWELKKFVVAAVLALAACGPVDPASIPTSGMYVAKPPAIWTDNEVSLARQPENLIGLCSAYNRGGWLSGGRLQPFTQADLNILAPLLRQHGLSARDMELLASRSRQFGTGQSFVGLVCSLGYRPSVNKSFYQGVGHRWQAVLPRQFVYLEGDGSDRNMRVTGWN